ncbi:MAG: CotH kinase family protein [Spirochaetota bacterium]
MKGSEKLRSKINLIALPLIGLILISGVLLITWAGNNKEERTQTGIRVIDFDEYRGTEASLPEGMFVSGHDGQGNKIGHSFYPYTGIHRTDPEREDEFLGFGAFTADGEDFSFGIRERGEAGLEDARLFLEYTNKTDRRIYGFSVSYEVEAWYLGERDNRIRLKFHTEPEGYGSIEEILSTANPLGEAVGDHAGEVYDGSKEENRARVHCSFIISELRGQTEKGVDAFTPLTPGETAYFRWQYSNNEFTEGDSRSALAIDDIRIEPLYKEDVYDQESPKIASPISFSHDPGFYDEPFELEMKSSLADAEIYYTTDGSRPDPEHILSDEQWKNMDKKTRTRTHQYREPIDIEELINRENELSEIVTTSRTDDLASQPPAEDVPKAAVIRGLAISGDTSSGYREASFFVPKEGAQHHKLPVWSILSNRDNFFSPKHGIYVPGTGDLENYMQRGKEWEREAHVEFFESDHSRVLAQPMGVRIHGNYTREFSQKSLRLYSRSDYGTARMSHRFFPSKELDDYNRLILRNGGNDWIRAMLTDSTLQTLVQHLPFETQHSRPSVLYINGEYWGIHNIRDRYDQHYFETHYGIPRDRVVILEDEGVVDVGKEGDQEPFFEFREKLFSGALTTWEAIDEYIPVSDYLDYLFAQLYAGNYDWPFNNARWWRYKGPDFEDKDGPRDGRWRPLMFDTDFSFGHKFSTTFDIVEWVFTYSEEHPFYDPDRRSREEERFQLNHRLMDVEEIRHEFLQRFAVHLSTTAHEQRAAEHVTQRVNRIKEEMPRQITRWNWPQSMELWQRDIDKMYYFAENRPSIIRTQLKTHFEDAGPLSKLTVSGLQGVSDISLHTVQLHKDTPGVRIEDGYWEGFLFLDLPVKFTSEQTDLRELELGPSENLEIISQNRNTLLFRMRGPVDISVKQPPPTE